MSIEHIMRYVLGKGFIAKIFTPFGLEILNKALYFKNFTISNATC